MNDPQEFFDQHPEAEMLEVFVVDVNGVLVGKKIPASGAGKLFSDGLRMPRSIFAMDIFGQDVLAAGLVSETGDNDGVCVAVPDTLHMVPWLENTAQVLLTMQEADGKPFFGDPRNVLKRVLDMYKRKGLTPVVAVELEFYMLDGERDEKGRPQPPLNPRTGSRSEQPLTLSLSEMQDYDGVLDDIRTTCQLQGIPADGAISENGPGQYEINIFHVPDAMAAADYAVLLKRVVRGVARNHKMDATFMAKPYGDASGSGLHVHFSVMDKHGANIFAGKSKKGSPELRFAVGGLLETMEDCTAIFAPNYNSYRRFAVGSHAPTTVTWGYDNRSSAIRIPDSDLKNTRIEHRVPGADANPHLMIAAMLAGALFGLDEEIDPGKPFVGDVYKSRAERLPFRWDTALAQFEESVFIEKFFGSKYRKLYLACKRQEKAQLEAQVSSLEYDAYLRDV